MRVVVQSLERFAYLCREVAVYSNLKVYLKMNSGTHAVLSTDYRPNQDGF